MDEATERAKLAAEDKANREWWAREQKLCTCGAAGTLEGHAEECEAAKDYNRAPDLKSENDRLVDDNNAMAVALMVAETALAIVSAADPDGPSIVWECTKALEVVREALNPHHSLIKTAGAPEREGVVDAGELLPVGAIDRLVTALKLALPYVEKVEKSPPTTFLSARQRHEQASSDAQLIRAAISLTSQDRPK